MSGEIFRNTALEAKFKVVFMPNIVMASITPETVYLYNESIGEIVPCLISKYEAKSQYPTTLGRNQIEVILTPIELLDKKQLYKVIASENVLGYAGWGNVISAAGSTILTSGYERRDILPSLDQIVYIANSPYTVQSVSGLWESRDSVITLILDRSLQMSGDVIRYGDIVKVTKGDKIYTVETCGIINQFYPADGANNIDKSVEIALGMSESMSIENIKQDQIQLHHVKWIPEYVEDLANLGNIANPSAFKFLNLYTKRWHEGHWADSGKESFHMVKYAESDTYVLQDYAYIVADFLEYNRNGWTRNTLGTNTLYYYRVHQQHRWDDPAHVVRYFYVAVPEDDATPPEEPADWESFDWTGIDLNNLCPECEIVARSAESIRFRSRENLELVSSGSIHNKLAIDGAFYQLVLFRDGTEYVLRDGETIEVQDMDGNVRGRFTILLVQGDVVTIFSSDPGSDDIAIGDRVFFVDPAFASCTTCEMIQGSDEIRSQLLYTTDYVIEPQYDYTPSGSEDPPPLSSNFNYGPPWIKECNGNLNYFTRRWHQNHYADGLGTGYHLVSYVNPTEDPFAFNPFKCQCCEWINSLEADVNFVRQANVELRVVNAITPYNQIEKFLTNPNLHFMPNIKAQFSFYEFRENYSEEEWTWLINDGLEKRVYPWKMNIATSYEDSLGSGTVPVTSGSQYLIKIQPMTDMDINWAKINEMQTDFQDPFLLDIPFPKILEPRDLLTGATYELFTSKSLESIEGIKEGVDTVTRFSVTPLIKRYYPEKDNLTVLPAEIVEIELDNAADLSTLVPDTVKLYYKNTTTEVTEYSVDYNNDTVIVDGNTMQLHDVDSNISITGPMSQYYRAEFIPGIFRLTYADGRRCGDYFIEYQANIDPITRETKYFLYIYLCENRFALSIVTRTFLIGTGYAVNISGAFKLVDGRELEYPKNWTFRTKQFVRWVSPVPDLENAPLACDVWISFNYELALANNIFFQNEAVLEDRVIGRTSDTSSVYIISEDDLFSIDTTPGKSSRAILDEHIGQYDVLSDYYKSGLITQINDSSRNESLIWIKIDSDYEPLTNYYIVLEPPIYTEDQGYTLDPVVYRFSTNRFVRWTSPNSYEENVPLNSLMYVQFNHAVAEDTLDARGVYVDKMYPPPSDPDPSARFSGPVSYDEESYRAAFRINVEVDNIDKNNDKGKKAKDNIGTLLNYPYTNDSRWLRLNITPNVVDYLGDTLTSNFEAPFTFHPLIREVVPNFGDREVYCLLEKFEIYSNIGNLVHWDQVVSDFPTGYFDPPRPAYRKTDGSGTLTEEARQLIYIENMSNGTKIYFDFIRQECSPTIYGYLGVPRLEAPSGTKHRTKLWGGFNNGEILKLEPGQSYRLVVSSALLVNVGKETGGLPYDEEIAIRNMFNTVTPSVANNSGNNWESRFRTALIEETYPNHSDKGIPLESRTWIKFAEPLDQSTIEDSVYAVYTVSDLRKVLDSVYDSTAYLQEISDPLDIQSRQLYTGGLDATTIPIGTRFTFQAYPSEPFYVESYIDATAFTFSPELPEFIIPSEDVLVFTPNRIKKRLLTEYVEEGVTKRDYNRGAYYFYLSDDEERSVQRTYEITSKSLTSLNVKIGTWFRIKGTKQFENTYFITNITDEGFRTKIEFWPRLESDTIAYNSYGTLIDRYMYLEFYPLPYPGYPVTTMPISVGDTYINCSGFLNKKYLPERGQFISLIDYSLTDEEIIEDYLQVDGYAISLQVSDVLCYRDNKEIEQEEVTQTDLVRLRLREASNVDLGSGKQVLLVPLPYRYFLFGSVYLRNNLQTDEPFVPGKLSYVEDNFNSDYRLIFTPDEPLQNSSIWVRGCDYETLFYNYSLMITTRIKTLTGSALLVPQEIPFRTWTYITRTSPEENSKTMPVFGTVRVSFKQNMTYMAGGPACYDNQANFYDQDGNIFGPLYPFHFLPSGVALDQRSYQTSSGNGWQMAVYASPRFEEGIEVYDRLDDLDIMSDRARLGLYGEFINGRVGPTFNWVAGTPLLTWQRCERIASNNQAAAGENQYVRYSLFPDTLYKAVLRYRMLKPTDVLSDQETGEVFGFDLLNSVICRLWEDKNYTWYFTTDKLVHSVYPEDDEQEVFSDEIPRVVFIDLMNVNTLKCDSILSERVVVNNELFALNNTVYLWRDTSIIHRDEAGNVLYTEEQRTQVPCTLTITTSSDYTENFAGHYTDSLNDDFSFLPVYLSTGRRHTRYHKPRTVVTLYPLYELKGGTDYYVSVTNIVETETGDKYATDFEFTSKFRTSELIRKISLETDDAADYVFVSGYPPFKPKFIKIMFHRHMDPESIGANEDVLVHDSFNRISVQRLPVDTTLAPPVSPRAHVAYRDNIFNNPVPVSGAISGATFFRSGETTGDFQDDDTVNIWAEWRPFSPQVLEPSNRDNLISLQIVLASSVKSVPYDYDVEYGDYVVSGNPSSSSTIFSLPFGLQKTVIRRPAFSGAPLVYGKIAMVYPSPLRYTEKMLNNRSCEVYCVPRQLDKITAEYFRPLFGNIVLKQPYWPIALLNNTTIIEETTLSFPDSVQRNTVELDINARLVNGQTYRIAFFPKIKFDGGGDDLDDEYVSTLAFDLQPGDTTLYLDGSNDLTGHKYLVVNRNLGPDPLMIEFSGATNTNRRMYYETWTIIDADTIDLTTQAYSNLPAAPNNLVYFRKFGGTKFYTAIIISVDNVQKTITVDLLYDGAFDLSDGTWELRVYTTNAAPTLFVDVPVTQLTIVERINAQPTNIYASIDCYTYAYSVDYHINNLVEHVTIEWEEDQYVMVIVFESTKRPLATELNTWLAEGRINIQRGDTSYELVLPLSFVTQYTFGTVYTKVMKIKPKITRVQGLRRPWDPWPFGGISQGLPFNLFMNKRVNANGTYICDRNVTQDGEMSGNYVAGTRTVVVTNSSAWLEAGKHIMINDWSYIMNGVTPAGADYSVVLDRGLRSNTVSGTLVYRDTVVDYYDQTNVDYIQQILCPSYPELAAEPVCKTSCEQGSCSENDTGVYSMTPAPFADNVPINTQIILFFTDRVLAITGEAVALYAIPEDVESLEGNEDDYKVQTRLFINENGLGETRVRIDPYTDFSGTVPLQKNMEYFVVIKKATVGFDGVPIGVKLQVQAQEEPSEIESENWLTNQAQLTESVIGLDFTQNIKQLSTTGWAAPPTIGSRIRLLNNSTPPMFKSYTIEFVENAWLNSGSVLVLHLSERVYTNHDDGATIEVEKEYGLVNEDFFLTQDEVFSFKTGELE